MAKNVREPGSWVSCVIQNPGICSSFLPQILPRGYAKFVQSLRQPDGGVVRFRLSFAGKVVLFRIIRLAGRTCSGARLTT
jgi:hypothetical protein